MDGSLREWLVKSAEELGEYSSDEDRLVAVGTFLFETVSEEKTEKTDEELALEANNSNVKASMSLDEICSKLSTHFPVVLTKETCIETLAEALLIYAVSPQSPDRGLFVQIIMEFQSEVQSDLMEAIKGNMQRHELEELVECQENEMDFVEALSVDQRSLVKTTDFICIECTTKEKNFETVRGELASAIISYNELELKLRAEIAQHGNKLIDSELMIIDKEEQIVECKLIIEKLNTKIKDLEREAKRSDIASDELQALKDEIDILRPRAER